MKKLYVHCLAFNSLKLVREAIELFEKQKGDFPIERKVLVDPKYPLTAPLTQEEHSRELATIAQANGWDYVRISNNLGMAGNWNWVISLMNPRDDDVILGVDADGRPVQSGYPGAMMDVFEHDPNCYTVQLNVPGTYAMQLPRFEYRAGHTNVIRYREPCAWTMGAFSMKWLSRAGGMQQAHPQYGFVEYRMEEVLRPKGGYFLILRDYYDQHLKAEDQQYTDWKLACAQFKTMLPFDQWLKERK